MQRPVPQEEDFTVIHIRLGKDMAREFKLLARQQDRTMSSLGRLVINSFLATKKSK